MLSTFWLGKPTFRPSRNRQNIGKKRGTTVRNSKTFDKRSVSGTFCFSSMCFGFLLFRSSLTLPKTVVASVQKSRVWLPIFLGLFENRTGFLHVSSMFVTESTHVNSFDSDWLWLKGCSCNMKEQRPGTKDVWGRWHMALHGARSGALRTVWREDRHLCFQFDPLLHFLWEAVPLSGSWRGLLFFIPDLIVQLCLFHSRKWGAAWAFWPRPFYSFGKDPRAVLRAYRRGHGDESELFWDSGAAMSTVPAAHVWLCCPTSGKHKQTAVKAYGFLNDEWCVAITIHDQNVAEKRERNSKLKLALNMNGWKRPPQEIREMPALTSSNSSNMWGKRWINQIYEKCRQQRERERVISHHTCRHIFKSYKSIRWREAEAKKTCTFLARQSVSRAEWTRMDTWCHWWHEWMPCSARWRASSNSWLFSGNSRAPCLLASCMASWSQPKALCTGMFGHFVRHGEARVEAWTKVVLVGLRGSRKTVNRCQRKPGEMHWNAFCFLGVH